MKLVAGSFTWPFRGGVATTWLVGVVTVVLLPLFFIPLLGYAVAATRAAERDPASGPPPWHLSMRLFWDGMWTALAVALTIAPFAIAWNPVAGALDSVLHDHLNAHLFALLILALPWGLLALIVLPHATASFAATGSVRDLFDYGAALRGVRRDFATWNLAAAAMVTAWAIGIACVGALCVGLVPGLFYAILVSAHAAAALHRESPHPSPG